MMQQSPASVLSIVPVFLLGTIDFQIDETVLYRRLTLNEVLNLTFVFKDIKLSSTKLQAHASLDDYPEENIHIGEGEEKTKHANHTQHVTPEHDFLSVTLYRTSSNTFSEMILCLMHLYLSFKNPASCGHINVESLPKCAHPLQWQLYPFDWCDDHDYLPC